MVDPRWHGSRAVLYGHFKGARKKISDDTIDRIYDWSRGQTYTIQLICNKLYGRHSSVKTEHFEQATHDILNQEGHLFANYTNLLTNTQWDVLKAIAHGEPANNPLSQDFIRRNHLGATSSVNTALKALIDKEIVIKEGESHLVHDVLLGRWLQRL